MMSFLSRKEQESSVGAPESDPLLTTDAREPVMISPTDALKNDVMLQELHESVERELIQTVSRWGLRVLIVLPGLASILLYVNGQDNYVNPMVVSLAAMLARFFSIQKQWNICFAVWLVMIGRHSLSQGCSASLVPAVYGFFPCAFGFLFRTTRAVVHSTAMVLLAIIVIFAVDLSGHCTSEPISKSQTTMIVADRLLPLLTLILGNSIVIIAIVKQSQKSLLLHAKAAKSASKLADVRRDVLHRVTHELRTPLNGIVGSVELLTTSETMNEYDMENALTIKSCLQNIVRICDDVLMAAKSRTGDDKVRKETIFLVASCIDDVVDIFGAAASQKGVSLKVEFSGNTQTFIRGMEVELRQVLLNLVGNALKFTEKGSITIRVKEQPSRTSDTVQYNFAVEDTGIGIEGEDSSMLFEAFQQGEVDAVSRQHKGTGLGLTICKDFVELMGGTIRVDSSRGRGSCFHFALDFQKASSENISPVFAFENERQVRVLIADSETESAATSQSIVSSMVSLATTKTCSSPSAVLDTISSEASSGDIWIAIVDCDSHKSTLSKLKESGYIIFGYGSPESLERSDGLYAVFRRPFPLIRLGNSLQAALAGELPIPLAPKSILREKHEATESSTVNMNSKDSSSITNTGRSKRQAQRSPSVGLRPGSKVVVVDDTPVNVKVLVKMLSRSTSVPIVSCFDGQSAVDLASSSSVDDKLLFLMDWHMPGVCGLRATNALRRIAEKRGGPLVYICMVTADIEGLYAEMDRRDMRCEGTVSKGELVEEGRNYESSTSESEDEIATAMKLSRQLERENSDGFTVVDIVAEKPVTFSSILAILSWFQKQVEESADTEKLSTRYFKRLGLDRDELDSLSSMETLQTICEAHVQTIPFENLSQHGVGEPVSLETTLIADKLLNRHRGGFCFELNGLLAELLLELGYNVVRVPAYVYTGDGYMEDASHMFLMVILHDDLEKGKSATKYLVDVGFAEPAIHPLRYEFGSVQVTSEGMTSRIVRNGDNAVLEWLDVETSAFVPRFKFRLADASIDGKGPALLDFQDNLKTVYHPSSVFERKIIVCCIDRLVKRTVAGNRVKITGPPRFGRRIVSVVQEIGDEDAVRAVLDSDFGIPLEETEGLTLSKSLDSPSNLWM